MNGARHQLFSSTGLSLNEDWQIRFSSALGKIADIEHLFTDKNEFVEFVTLFEEPHHPFVLTIHDGVSELHLATEVSVPTGELPTLQRTPQQQKQLIRMPRSRNKLIDSGLIYDSDHILKLSVFSDQDSDGLRLQHTRLHKYIEPRDVGHPQIAENDIDFIALDDGKRILPRNGL